ncbi:hypothetical protein RUM43_006649 [Polyplax serrata]|uniref:Glutaredoxin domain-containing protein n=1 Tax=Polyplax serrata TaxID=468196 RepID=A0AAN8P1K7_POLSC
MKARCRSMSFHSAYNSRCSTPADSETNGPGPRFNGSQVQSYKDRDAGKVVVYTTTMGIVRETYHKCLKVKQILRTLMVKFEERDVFMSSEAQADIRERMKCSVILVPQVFVEGQHIGELITARSHGKKGDENDCYGQ